MAKLSNTKKSRVAEKFGKGKVTPVQVAFIVDRYLYDNNYTQSRIAFRSEASDLISGSPVEEVPKSLLSLGEMLDEYINLKEHKVFLDQERYRLEQDKFRVNNLLKGFQDSMTAFNASAHLVRPPLPSPNLATIMPNTAPTPTSHELPIGSPAAGCYSSVSTPVVMSRFNMNTREVDPSNISIPAGTHTNLKRKGFKDGPDAPPTVKRHHKSFTSKSLNLADTHSQSHQAKGEGIRQPSQIAIKSISNSKASSGSQGEGPGVVKCLFNQKSQSPPVPSSLPETPPLTSFSQADKLASPLKVHSFANSGEDVNQEPTTNCTVISTETVQVSPNKHILYHSIARNHQISTISTIKSTFKTPNRRDHVKNKLEFDATGIQINTKTPESLHEVDILDMDMTSFEALGNISLTELLVNFDIDNSGVRQPHVDSSPESILCSPAKLEDVHEEINRFMSQSQISSTVTESYSDKDMNSSGVDSVTTLTPVTKCIKISSPAKSHMWLLDEEN